MMKSRLLTPVALVTFLISSHAGAATIDLVGGSLSARVIGESPNVSPITGPGDYQATQSKTVVFINEFSGEPYTSTFTGTASASITESRIDVSASANGYTDPFTFNSASMEAWGVVDFHLSTDSNVFFDYSATIFPYGTNGTARLLGPDGAAVLVCDDPSAFFPACSGPGLPEAQASAWLTLGAGDYQLLFNAYHVVAMSNSYGGRVDMSLDVHAVPLPAALWLFASGLSGLMGMAARRRAFARPPAGVSA